MKIYFIRSLTDFGPFNFFVFVTEGDTVYNQVKKKGDSLNIHIRPGYFEEELTQEEYDQLKD